jgi:hypothetical protein
MDEKLVALLVNIVHTFFMRHSGPFILKELEFT